MMTLMMLRIHHVDADSLYRQAPAAFRPSADPSQLGLPPAVHTHH
jgi:hypothetical protein